MTWPNRLYLPETALPPGRTGWRWHAVDGEALAALAVVDAGGARDTIDAAGTART